MPFSYSKRTRKRPHTVPRGEASLARQHRIVKAKNCAIAQFLSRLHQQPRDQFRSPLHLKLYEDVPQVEFHCLLAHTQSLTTIGVCQALYTAKRDLSFSPASHQI